ncbi:MAG: hypothetical protein HY664_01725 [Chloroflexi bacterium]|nr:hypothetical protein [Chloroflexota bacterium]
MEQTDHYSARLELYFHHHFKAQGFKVDFHPELKDSPDHPDFLVHHKSGDFYLEAKIRHDEPSFVEQAAFADRLRGELEGVCSPHFVTVSIPEPCPPEKFLPEIKNFLEKQLALFNEEDEAEKRVPWRKLVYVRSYELWFPLHRRLGACQPLAVSPIWGGTSGISDYLYESVDGKARKYGNLDLPFVIAVWGLSSPGQFSEENALYGTEALEFRRDPNGDPIKNSERVVRRPDGIFTIIEDGQLKNKKVSAVVFYQDRLDVNDHQHILRVYHNLYALNPLSHEVFDGVPQLVPVEVDDHIKMHWLNGPPD